MFYFSSDALVDALCKLSAERGISVRVLADVDMNQTATRPILEKLHDHGVAVVVAGTPGYGKLHHKCAVVDGKVVLTGAANWSEAAGESNHEDVLALYSPVLAAQYLDRLDEIEATGKPLGGPLPSKVARRPRRRLPQPRRNQPGEEVQIKEVRVYFTPDRKGVFGDLLPMLKNATTVDIGMYLLTDKTLLSTLEEISSNATVRVVADEDTLAGRGLGRLQRLWDAGVQVVSFHKDRAAMHLKAVVIDDRYVWTGSGNWTANALDSSFEDFLCFDSPALATLYSETLDDIFCVSESFEAEALDLDAPDEEEIESGFDVALPATGPRTNFTDFDRVPFPGFEARGKVAYLPDEKYQPALRRLIRGARQSIFIGMYVFSEQKREAPFAEGIIHDLKVAAQRGVYVYLLLYNAPSTVDRLAAHHSNRAEKLRRLGIDVRLALPTTPLHMKTVIVDLSKVLVGSHNWSEGSLSGKRVFESSALIVLDGQEPKAGNHPSSPSRSIQQLGTRGSARRVGGNGVKREFRMANGYCSFSHLPTVGRGGDPAARNGAGTTPCRKEPDEGVAPPSLELVQLARRSLGEGGTSCRFLPLLTIILFLTLCIGASAVKPDRFYLRDGRRHPRPIGPWSRPPARHT